jgi:hypothetical protein
MGAAVNLHPPTNGTGSQVGFVPNNGSVPDNRTLQVGIIADGNVIPNDRPGFQDRSGANPAISAN